MLARQLSKANVSKLMERHMNRSLIGVITLLSVTLSISAFSSSEKVHIQTDFRKGSADNWFGRVFDLPKNVYDKYMKDFKTGGQRTLDFIIRALITLMI